MSHHTTATPPCASCGEPVDHNTPPGTVCVTCREPVHLSCLNAAGECADCEETAGDLHFAPFAYGSLMKPDDSPDPLHGLTPTDAP